jgi:hypothetical protein
MGLVFRRRLNCGSGLFLNLSGGGASFSKRLPFGSIGSRGFSIRSGIPGVYFLKRYSRKDAAAGTLMAIIIGFFSIVFPLLIQMLAIAILWAMKLIYILIFLVALIAVFIYRIAEWLILTAIDNIYKPFTKNENGA